MAHLFMPCELNINPLGDFQNSNLLVNFCISGTIDLVCYIVLCSSLAAHATSCALIFVGEVWPTRLGPWHDFWRITRRRSGREYGLKRVETDIQPRSVAFGWLWIHSFHVCIWHMICIIFNTYIYIMYIYIYLDPPRGAKWMVRDAIKQPLSFFSHHLYIYIQYHIHIQGITYLISLYLSIPHQVYHFILIYSKQTIYQSGQITATENTTDFPQMVVKRKGPNSPAISGFYPWNGEIL